MIDTIALTIPFRNLTILNKRRFNNLSKDNNKMFYKITINPTKKDLLQGIYLPRVTATRRKYGNDTLRVEFSAPKMLYGNNLKEIKESDFEMLVKKIKDCLKYYDILVFSEVIKKSKIQSVHYCKNIRFEDGTSVSMILNELNKIDMTRRWDLSRTRFRNEGHALTYHTNTFELVFYDKMRDMEQAKISEKRAIEKDNIIQMSLFDEIKKRPKPIEILRIELRLNEYRKIAKMTGINWKEVRFESVFKQSLSDKLLRQYWNDIENKIDFLQIDCDSPTDLLEEIVFNNPHYTPSKALQLTCIILAFNDSNQRRVKNILAIKGNKNIYYRMTKELKNIEIKKHRKFCAIKQISNKLNCK